MRIVSVLLLLTLSSCGFGDKGADGSSKHPTSQHSDEFARKITEKEAISIAEQYLRDHGFTTAAPNLSLLAEESPYYALTAEELASLRHNMVNPKAYGVSYAKGTGWFVDFAYSQKEIDRDHIKIDPEVGPVGFGVHMDDYGKNVDHSEKDVRLIMVDKKL